MGHACQAPLVGVGQFVGQFRYRNPGHLGDFDVLVAQFAAGEPHEVVVDGLVHAPAIGDEPVVDAAESGQNVSVDAGFLGDFPDGGLLGGLALFDVSLGQRPEHPSAPVHPADQGSKLFLARPIDPVDDQSAGGGFVDGPKPRRGTAALPGLARRGLFSINFRGTFGAGG